MLSKHAIKRAQNNVTVSLTHVLQINALNNCAPIQHMSPPLAQLETILSFYISHLEHSQTGS